MIYYDATIEWGVDGGSFASIPKAKGIAVPAEQQNYVDVTSLDSPNRYREFEKGLIDTGEETITCGYTRAGYAQALTYKSRTEPVDVKITFPIESGDATASTVEFQAHVNPSLVSSDNVEDELTFTIAFRMTGAPTFTEGTAA